MKEKEKMMKKLLIFMLVLGMASAANATLSATLSGDDTPGAGNVSLSIVPDVAQLDNMMAITLIGTGAMSSSALGVSAPGDSEFACTMGDVELAGTYGEGDIYVMASYTSTYDAGVWITASYAGAVVGDVIYAYESYDGETWDVLDTITVIPEPMTVLLLGLGGLFLRRRKG